MYYSNGTSWTFLNVPYQATQEEVNAGTNTNKFVTPETLKNQNYLATETYVDDALALKKDTILLQCSHSVQNLADSTNYFFGTFVGFAPTTSTSIARRFEAPITGNIKEFFVSAISQTPTSSEDVSLVLNNKTTGLSYTLGNIRYNNVSIKFNFSGFTIPITKNDSLEFQIIVPVLATNGVGSYTTINVIFEK